MGSANVDLTFHTQRMPKPGETMAGRAFHLGMGGKGANQAVAAARLGARVSLVARVGSDTFGREAVIQYQRDGIDTSFVISDAGQSTGTAAIIVDDDAENCIIVVAGANAGLSPGDVRTARAVVQNADTVLCQLETPLETTSEAFRLARDAGVRTIMTPAPATQLSDERLRLCDVCVPNKSEAELLTGRSIDGLADAEAAARELRTRGVGTVVVTMGHCGAIVFDSEGATHVPAVEVVAVDTTGAGDAFTAALSVFVAEGLSVRDAARMASIVAAITVTRLGTQTAFPTRAEVETGLRVGTEG